MTKVLVAYGRKHNSTAEIAQAISKALQEAQSLEVEVEFVEAISHHLLLGKTFH